MRRQDPGEGVAMSRWESAIEREQLGNFSRACGGSRTHVSDQLAMRVDAPASDHCAAASSLAMMMMPARVHSAPARELARISDAAMLGMVIAANANAQAIASVLLRSMPCIGSASNTHDAQAACHARHARSKMPGSQTLASDPRTADPDPGIRDRRAWVLGSPSPGPG